MRGRERLGRMGIVVTLVALCAVLGAMAVSAQAVPQPPAGQTPPAPAQPPAGPPAAGQPAPAKPPTAPPTGLSFLGEAGLALFTVKSEGAADFEAFFAPLVGKVGRLRLIHGEREQAAQLARTLRDLGFADVACPESGEAVPLG